jgi:hypothetical protein
MRNALLRFLGSRRAKELSRFEPIYGLPRRSLDEWLARNPQLRKEYEIELAARLRRTQPST